MGKRRTPAELIAESERRTNDLKRRHAIEQAKESPELAFLVSRFEDIESQVRKAGTLSADTPQGFAHRRKLKLLWIAEIDAQENLSAVLIRDGDSLVDDLRDTIFQLAESLAAGEECADAVSDAEKAVTEFDSPELKELFGDYESAREARQTFSDSGRTSNA